MMEVDAVVTAASTSNGESQSTSRDVSMDGQVDSGEADTPVAVGTALYGSGEPHDAQPASMEGVENSVPKHQQDPTESVGATTTPSDPNEAPTQGNHFSLEDAPVFHPTTEEFSDPLVYIRSIRAEAQRYGIARIVPPKVRNCIHSTHVEL